MWNPFKKKSVSISDPQIAQLFGFADQIYAGITVNPNTAMQHATVYSCVSKLTGAIGQMPIRVYNTQGKHRKLSDQYWTKSITKYPNGFQTTQVFLEQIVLHLCLHGNYYAIIRKNSRGKIIDITPVKPQNVNITISQGDIIYNITELETEIGEKKINCKNI